MTGSIVLTAALTFSLIATVFYYFTYRGANNTLNYARLSFHAMAMLVIIASTLLVYYLVTHQYEFKYVYSYSNSDLPIGLLIATFWAGQEGSFMLWLLLTSIVGLILQSYTSKRGDLEYRVMAVYGLATTFLLIMVSPIFKNPFAYIWAEPVFIDIKNIAQGFLNQPFLQSFIFSDQSNGQNFVKLGPELYASLSGAGISVNEFIIHGKGLNPLLQNFWMQIHPPILFIGFSMATVPFAFAIAALMKNDYQDWVRQSLPWVLTGSGVLGLGIMLGGYWAYGVLGWGGYWAWDPVENSSLVPWLVMVASIHTLLVQKKSQNKNENLGKFAKTNLILCMLTYILVLYSTFLTRSGVLGDASVHSFVDPGTIVYLFLIIFIGTFLFLGIGMLAYRWKYINEHVEHDENLLSRDLALFTGTVTICASAIIVFVGTSAPIFGQAVDIIFYNEMHIPIGIIIGLLNGLSLSMKWKKSSFEEIVNQAKFSGIAAIVLTLLVVFLGGVYNVMMILLTLSTAFALFINGETAFKIMKNNKRMIGAYISHIGISLFILGVIGSSAYSDEKDIQLAKGESISAYGYNLTFTGYYPIDNGKKYAFNIDVEQGSKSFNVSPIMYVSDFNNSIMREPDILNGVFRDFYVAPLSYDPGEGDEHSHDGAAHIVLQKGNTQQVDDATITFEEFNFSEDSRNAMMSGGAFEIGAVLKVVKNGKTYFTEPKMKGVGSERSFVSTEIEEANLKFELENLDASGKIELHVKTLDGNEVNTKTETKEILAVTASIKPFVNLVWIGTIVMTLGFFVAMGRRLKESWN